MKKILMLSLISFGVTCAMEQDLAQNKQSNKKVFGRKNKNKQVQGNNTPENSRADNLKELSNQVNQLAKNLEAFEGNVAQLKTNQAEQVLPGDHEHQLYQDLDSRLKSIEGQVALVEQNQTALVTTLVDLSKSVKRIHSVLNLPIDEDSTIQEVEVVPVSSATKMKVVALSAGCAALVVLKCFLFA